MQGFRRPFVGLVVASIAVVASAHWVLAVGTKLNLAEEQTAVGGQIGWPSPQCGISGNCPAGCKGNMFLLEMYFDTASALSNLRIGVE